MTSATDRNNLRAVLDVYVGHASLPRAVRDLFEVAFDAEDIEATMQRTAAALVALETHADWAKVATANIRNALLICMTETGAPNIALQYHTIGTQQRRALHIDERLLPPAFLKQALPSPDSAAIRKALDAGDVVPGVVQGNGRPVLFIRSRSQT